MQIQVSTDDNVDGNEDLVRQIETEVSSTLSRFSDRITRVEVHLSDENAAKPGTTDKRCLIEARPAGRKPMAVSHTASGLLEACSGALRKMTSSLESEFGRLDDHKGAASIRKDGEP